MHTATVIDTYFHSAFTCIINVKHCKNLSLLLEICFLFVFIFVINHANSLISPFKQRQVLIRELAIYILGQ